MSTFSYSSRDAKAWAKGNYFGTLVDFEAEPDRLTLYWDAVHPVTHATKRVRDCIVVPSGVFKLRNLAAQLGLLNQFESDTFDPDEHLKRGAGLWLELVPSKAAPNTNFMSIQTYNRNKPMPRKTPPSGNGDYDIPIS